ncbi:MAG: hypothetical protein AAB578_02905, partial [Elusimicrobiota bacterium]
MKATPSTSRDSALFAATRAAGSAAFSQAFFLSFLISSGPASAQTFTGSFGAPNGAVYDSGPYPANSYPEQVADVLVDTATAGGPYVYVVGTSSRGSQGYDWAAIRYDSIGSKLDFFTYGSAGADDKVYDAAQDGAGNIYLA